MRITNKVMQNNSLTNINKNKVLQDSLTTQLTTGKKINKPSEDPVTAIRALRLRSDVSQVTQFSKKNAPDAQSWLEITESSVKTTISVVKDMIEKCEKGSNDTLTTEDRKIIIDSLKELREEVYATGNADYAGRFLFTGYRTDTPLTFTENTIEEYHIWESFTGDDIDKMTYVSTISSNTGNDINDITETSYDGSAQMAETDITSNEYFRIRLAYGNLDDSTWSTGLYTEDWSGPIVDGGGSPISYTTSIATGTAVDAAYKDIATTTDNKMILLPETGEILLSKSLYDAIKNGDANITFEYDKKNWTNGDLRPEHYFACEKNDTTKTPAEVIKYNQQSEDGDAVFDVFQRGLSDQPIEYQVGFNQDVRVNTVAGEVYIHDVGRDVDELLNLANSLSEVENTRDKLKDMAKDTEIYTEAQLDNIKADLDAAEKAVTLMKDQLQKMFAKNITNMQGHLDTINSALTTIGNRSSRLSLITNRLEDQTTTFKTLQSENEDADATEVAVQLSSAQVSYQAALMATSDMIKETLLNYL